MLPLNAVQQVPSFAKTIRGPTGFGFALFRRGGAAQIFIGLAEPVERLLDTLVSNPLRPAAARLGA